MVQAHQRRVPNMELIDSGITDPSRQRGPYHGSTFPHGIRLVVSESKQGLVTGVPRRDPVMGGTQPLTKFRHSNSVLQNVTLLGNRDFADVIS